MKEVSLSSLRTSMIFLILKELLYAAERLMYQLTQLVELLAA